MRPGLGRGHRRSKRCSCTTASLDARTPTSSSVPEAGAVGQGEGRLWRRARGGLLGPSATPRCRPLDPTDDPLFTGAVDLEPVRSTMQ
jgi:hypothetical protein